MNIVKSASLTLLCLGASLTASHALTVVDSNYTSSAYYTHATGDAIVSYDWDSSGNLYYQTSSASYSFGGFYKHDDTGTTTIAAASEFHYPGASVVSIGDYVYYNVSNQSNTQYIYKYGPLSTTPSLASTSTTPNWGLYGHNGSLFITGAEGFGTNHIYHSAIDGGGNIAASATDLGATSGSSGPLAFDSAGNLYYAPGFGDLSIYKWSAAELSAALADPETNPLFTNDHLWVDYSVLYGSVSGATSMLIDDQGNLLVTLTSFSDPSALVAFNIDEFGNYVDASTLLTDTDRLGELRLLDGNLYLSSGDIIYQISAVPEPATFAALGGAFALGSAALRRRRR